MADDTTATIIQLHQPKPLTAAERGRAFRQRQRDKAVKAAPVKAVPTVRPAKPNANAGPNAGPTVRERVRGVRFAPVAVTVAAFGLAAVGITMNGWFARSLGSSDVAGWLFLGIGVAADLAALAVPACAAHLWQTRQRGTALAAWAIWFAAFAFAVTAGVGFASLNIADVTLARSQRSSPSITNANAALADAMAARDRECSVVGKICREREATVNERRRAVDSAMTSVEQTADPQTDAAVKIVAWLTMGIVKPKGDDFAMLRLVLLALLPQLGGLLLMVGRAK